jgi:Leucine-rich repeat (LRR) protein
MPCRWKEVRPTALRACLLTPVHWQIQDAIEAARTSGHLDLSDMHMTEVPKAILGLDHVTTLNLSNNSLETLPVEVAALKNLQSLHLGNNLLRALPWTLGSIPHLHWLNVDDNPLEAARPPPLP